MVLARVAHEQDALDSRFTRPMQEAVHLPRREETGLVDDPELLAAKLWRRPLKQRSDRACYHARFGERFHRAGGRCETLDGITLLLAELSDRADGRGLGGARASLDCGEPIMEVSVSCTAAAWSGASPRLIAHALTSPSDATECDCPLPASIRAMLSRSNAIISGVVNAP